MLIGVGAEAAQELARDVGLEIDNGIVVNRHCRTSDPWIYAAGDCTSHPSVRYGGQVRLESVDNAFEQATTAALSMLGEPAVHDGVPWFWSEQFDLKLTITGLGLRIRPGHSRSAFSEVGAQLLRLTSSVAP